MEWAHDSIKKMLDMIGVKQSMEKEKFIDKEDKIPTSRFTIFRRDNYLSISNVDLDVLIKLYKKYDNEPHIERVNISILEMIQAYDIDHKGTNLLDITQSLSEWLSDKYSENSVYVLNYYRTVISGV